MHKNSELLLFAAAVYTCILLYLSFATVNDLVPETGFRFQDKLFHFLAYVLLALVWGFFAKSKRRKILFFYSFVATLIFGISVELLQESINPLRTYDIIDLFANCLGVIVGTIIVVYFSKKRTLK